MREYYESRMQYTDRLVLVFDRRNYKPDCLITVSRGTGFSCAVGAQFESDAKYHGPGRNSLGLPDWRDVSLVSLHPWTKEEVHEVYWKYIEKYKIQPYESMILISIDEDDYRYQIGQLVQNHVFVFWEYSDLPTEPSEEGDGDYGFKLVTDWDEDDDDDEDEEPDNFEP